MKWVIDHSKWESHPGMQECSAQPKPVQVTHQINRRKGKYQSHLSRCRKSIWQNSTSFPDTVAQQMRCRRDATQYSKGYKRQAHGWRHPHGEGQRGPAGIIFSDEWRRGPRLVASSMVRGGEAHGWHHPQQWGAERGPWLASHSIMREREAHAKAGVTLGDEGWRGLWLASPSTVRRHTQWWGVERPQLAATLVMRGERPGWRHPRWWGVESPRLAATLDNEGWRGPWLASHSVVRDGEAPWLAPPVWWGMERPLAGVTLDGEKPHPTMRGGEAPSWRHARTAGITPVPRVESPSCGTRTRLGCPLSPLLLYIVLEVLDSRRARKRNKRLPNKKGRSKIWSYI